MNKKRKHQSESDEDDGEEDEENVVVEEEEEEEDDDDEEAEEEEEEEEEFKGEEEEKEEEEEVEEEEVVQAKGNTKKTSNKKQQKHVDEEEKEVVQVKEVKIKKASKNQKTNDSKASLIERYSKLASTMTSFGKTKAWYTLKFNTLRQCTAAQYYVVQMELSNDDDGEQLNIWLKASFIHDVLKCLVHDDPDSLPLFNGFEDVIRNAELGELRLKPYGDNVCRANKKGNFTYKDFFNYYMIPKEMGPYKATIEKFKNTMVKLLNSDQFFSLMTVYQKERTNEGGQPGKILRDENSDVWQQLKKENNNQLKYMDALNAKFMDDTIIVILHRLYGEDSILAKYQRFGWHDREKSPFPKSKKN
jgi:hypothetical protein